MYASGESGTRGDEPDTASNNAVRPVREMPVPLKFAPLIWDPYSLCWRYPTAERDPSVKRSFVPTKDGGHIASKRTPCPVTKRGARDYLLAGSAREPLHGGESPDPQAA